ncbi:PRC-barrel domain-containing protein [Breoghania sp. L-A4]|uniref:PRC-barrel domain-containing protein n=1 Tax=Breoghania sp. L-A4 TaxID=2304600 RepID=UPI0013C3396B|nr:PRC-barrel domain-containing protein [Breoghania sp. L-A4]
MIRTLLTTTAVAALISTGALAADNTKPMEDTKAMENTQSTNETSSAVGIAVFTMSPDMPSMNSDAGYFTAQADQVLASTLIGQTIYNGTGEEAKAIGDVNDVVLGPNGQAEAVVVSVGGFLGMGEKDVAVDFDRLGWTERDGQKWLTMAATESELKNAPAFDRAVIEGENEKMASDMNDDTMSSGTAMLRDVTGTDDHNTQVVVDASTASADALIGTAVYGAQEENLGDVSDVIVSADGKVEAYIIDVGGFLGIGEKPVALNASKLDIKKDDAGALHIYTTFTQKQLESFPEYSEEAYAKNPESVLAN